LQEELLLNIENLQIFLHLKAEDHNILLKINRCNTDRIKWR